MFTGLIEEVGTIESARAAPSGLALVIRAPLIASGCAPGDSVSVSGLCLTAEAAGPVALRFHVGAESLARTTASDWRPGRAVNLERALRADARLGGHIVQGHVDGTGEMLSRRPEGQTERFSFSAPSELLTYVTPRGSIAVDGISLTVTEVDQTGFSVAIIPFTIAKTTLARLGPGDRVNLEVDVLARYVERLLHQRGLLKEGLSERFLAEHGFMS